MTRLLSRWGFTRPTPEAQAERDLAEARIAFLEACKMREYYEAMEAMLQRRIIRLTGERHA